MELESENVDFYQVKKEEMVKKAVLRSYNEKEITKLLEEKGIAEDNIKWITDTRGLKGFNN